MKRIVIWAVASIVTAAPGAIAWGFEDKRAMAFAAACGLLIAVTMLHTQETSRR